MSQAKFIHLRNHTAYSLAEGALKTKTIEKLCSEYDMPAVGITDTNNMFGAAEFSKFISGDGIQPIIGTQLNVDFNLLAKNSHGEKTLSQLVLLIKNETGYNNLLKILSKSYLETPENEIAHVNKEILREHKEGIIALTGGVKGIVNQLILVGKNDLAEKTLLELNDIYKNNIYIEIQRHGLKEENNSELPLLELAYKHNIPLVATNECYFADKDIYKAHDALLCVADGRYVDEENRRHETEEHYFKSQEEMLELFKDIPEACENTINIAKRCSYIVPHRPPLLPHVEKGVDEKEALRDKSIEGLKQRLIEREIPKEEQQQYFDRMDYELKVIIEMGFEGYFLIVSDFIKWGKAKDIPVGPGRGSGAGSVVAWALTITDLDPIYFGLLFERFLNPERVSMPDFDIDFCQDRREEVIEYVQNKYGFDHVAQIITFGKLQARAVIRDVGRVLRMPYPKVDGICKLIPGMAGTNITITEAMEEEPELSNLYENDNYVKQLLDYAMKLEGLFRHASTHAAGVVIGDRPLDQLVALYKDPKSSMPVSQFNMKYVEDTGLIKYDFLGLKTLSIIKQANDFANSIHGANLDINHISYNDEKTFKLLGDANTVGVFQFESSGMQNILFQLKPNKIEDLISIISLYRPGPMGNIPSYIARKNGKETVAYPHPILEASLKETYGIIVYQEQVMKAAQDLAGYSLGGADILRRGMGKKIKEVMDEQREVFKKGCLEHNNIDAKKSDEIFDLIAKFAEYGFNKSHAAAYAWVSYQTAYLKAHFPVEFYAASMNYDLNNVEKLQIFAEDIKKSGIKLLPPDINKSMALFAVEDGAVRYSLAAIKNVGEQAMKVVETEREENGEFTDLNDFISRFDTKIINKRMFENLIKAGAFDNLEPNRGKLFKALNSILSTAASYAKDKETNQVSLFGGVDDEATKLQFKLPESSDWTPTERSNLEKDAIGFYLASHPMESYKKAIENLNITKISEIENITHDSDIKIAGMIEDYNERISQRTGNKFGIALVTDDTSSCEILFSGRSLTTGNKEILDMKKHEKPVLISCAVKITPERKSLFGGNIEKLGDASANEIKDVTVKINNTESIEKLRHLLKGIQEGRGKVKMIIRDEKSGKAIYLSLPKQYSLSEETINMVKNIDGIFLCE